MRRTVVGIAVVAALATSVTSFAAGPSAARQVVRPYVAATTAVTSNGLVQGSGVVVETGAAGERTFGLVFVNLRSTEQRATIRLADTTGRTVQAFVQQTAKNGTVFRIGVVCGATAKPLRLAPGGGTLVVRPSYGLCGQQPSVPTTGSVFVTLR